MTSFATTFLGHQGWLVRAGRSTVLIDPLLNEQFGDIHALDYRIYPPRILRHEAFPAVDAVVLSHEHDDHFDIPSLAHLDRGIPIHLSAHSSISAFRILREMGFKVHPLVPGIRVDVGDLEIIPFTGDHISVNCADEWDTLPYLVRDKNGGGSLFSMVDVMLMPHHVHWAKAHVPKPGLVTWSNNALDWSHMGEQPARDVGTEQCLKGMESGHKLIASTWGTPAAMLMCAGGFTFYGDRSWFNQRVFWVDTEAACRHMRALHRGEQFYSAVPGQTFLMRDHRVVSVEESTPFLSAAPRADWPARGRSLQSDTPDYTPATGRRDLDAGDRAELRDRLTEVARAMIGGILFRSLHSILASEAHPRKLTFALVLRHGNEGAADVFEYDGSACAFVPVTPAEPRDVYVAGWECWATDMLAVLRGEMGPIAMIFGRARIWNALPQRLRFDLLDDLISVSHPLCRPGEYYRVYQRFWDQSRGVIPTIRAGSSSAHTFSAVAALPAG